MEGLVFRYKRFLAELRATNLSSRAEGVFLATTLGQYEVLGELGVSLGTRRDSVGGCTYTDC